MEYLDTVYIIGDPDPDKYPFYEECGCLSANWKFMEMGKSYYADHLHQKWRAVRTEERRVELYTDSTAGYVKQKTISTVAKIKMKLCRKR